MAQFQKIWAPIAAIAGAILLSLQLAQAFSGNRSLVSGLLILISLIALGASIWKYAFAPSVIPNFPRYKYHWAAKIGIILDSILVLLAGGYILTILDVIPDYYGLVTTKAPTSPEIFDIKIREPVASPNPIIYADIYFSDTDGDSYIVTYELIHTTANDIHLWNDPVTAAINDQIAGTIVTVDWNCVGTGYTVSLNARILDKAGNKSNPFPLVFDCK